MYPLEKSNVRNVENYKEKLPHIHYGDILDVY